MRIRIWSVTFFLCLLLGLTSMPVQAEQRCFPETGFCIDGKIRTFWEKNGGLPVFGFPIGAQENILSEDKAITMQRFERNRIELHPWNNAPYDVQLGRLGDTKLKQQNRDWFAFPNSGAQTGCRFFIETNHNVCGDILKAWRKNGLQLDANKAISEAESLALFGLPLSDLMTETLSDGKEYQVQWFERARFELHPENAPPYNVLLGLLGNETGKFGLTFNPDKFLDLSDADATGDDKPLKEYLLRIEEFAPGSTQTQRYFDRPWITGIEDSALLDSFNRDITPKNVPGVFGFTQILYRTRSEREAHDIQTRWYRYIVDNMIESQSSDFFQYWPTYAGIDETMGICYSYRYTVPNPGQKTKYEDCTTYIFMFRKGNIILHLEIDGGGPERKNLSDFAGRVAARFAE